MDSVGDTPKGVGCPIRKSADQRSLSSPRGLSQSATSFIASWRQGIHQMPFSHLSLGDHVMHRDQPPKKGKPDPAHAACSATRGCYTMPSPRTTGPAPYGTVPSIGTTAHPTDNTPPKRHAPDGRQILFTISKNRTMEPGPHGHNANPCLPGQEAPRHAMPRLASLVEPTGIEPVTSSLQSSRSPN